MKSLLNLEELKLLENHPCVKPFNIIDELPTHPTKKYKLRKLSNIKRIVVHTTDWDTTPKVIAQFDIKKSYFC